MRFLMCCPKSPYPTPLLRPPRSTSPERLRRSGALLAILMVLALMSKAEAASLHPRNLTLGMDPFVPAEGAPWTIAARPRDVVQLSSDDLPEKIADFQVVLSGDRRRTVISPDRNPEGMAFSWPGGFASGERVTVLLERASTWESLYREGRRWLQHHLANAPEVPESPHRNAPLPHPATVVALEEGDPVLIRATADPTTLVLLLKGQNLRGRFTASFPNGHRVDIDNGASGTLRLPYDPTQTPGTLTVTRSDGRRSNPIWGRFPQKVTGLLALPDQALLDLTQVEILDPARLDREDPTPEFPLRSDGSFVTGVEGNGHRVLAAYIHLPGRKNRVLLASADIPPGEDSVLLVVSPEALARVKILAPQSTKSGGTNP